MGTKKTLGQNFLVDYQVVEDLIQAAKVKQGDAVFEVGAGTGTVTKPLAERAGRVIAVEIDKDLIPKLQVNLKGLKNIKIINKDILRTDIRIQRYYKDARDFKVVGSIPYQITSPLLHKLLALRHKPTSVTIIVQKEVAEKVAAKPPKATYLSNFVANFGQAKIIRMIRPSAFHPQPKVDSAILHIDIHREPLVAEPERLSAFLHRGFAQPRKMLNKQFPAETLKKLDIDPQKRPHMLNLDEWLKLFKEVRNPLQPLILCHYTPVHRREGVTFKSGGAAAKTTLDRRLPSSAW